MPQTLRSLARIANGERYIRAADLGPLLKVYPRVIASWIQAEKVPGAIKPGRDHLIPETWVCTLLGIGPNEEVPTVLRPSGAATMLRASPTELKRLANAGELSVIRLVGGHRRYLETSARALAGSKPKP